MKILYRACFLVLVLLQSCSDGPWLSGTIQMDVKDKWKPMVYLVRPNSLADVGQSFMGMVLDSVALDEAGNFRFKRYPPFDKPTLLQVVVQEQGEIYPNKLWNENPITDNYMPIIYQPGESMVVTATVSKFQESFMVESPSDKNKALMELRDIRLKAYARLQYQLRTLSGDENLLEREKVMEEYQTKIMEFANQTDELLPSLMAFRWTDVSGDYERIPEFVTGLCEKWNHLTWEDKWVRELTTMADKSKLPILEGDIAPNIIFPMKDGKQMALNELLNDNQLVLLDAWASWCAPCRVENRNVLVPLWEKYRYQGFQIMAYGLESSEKAWENAIERDGAHRWLHASHLTGDQNPFMEELRIHIIPANFLLDKNGKVLAKNIHGDELAQFVADYLGQKPIPAF